MTPKTSRAYAAFVLTCTLFLAFGCNITDPDAGIVDPIVITTEDAGGGDDGGPATPDAEADAEADTGACPGGAARNACGGCDDLGASVGDPCSNLEGFAGFECGNLTCRPEGTLGCNCPETDGCVTNAQVTACACDEGYEPNGTTTCADVDECPNNVCDELTTCTNTVGGFTCSACPAGTVDVNDDGTDCVVPLEDIEAVKESGFHPGNTSTCIQANCPAGKIAIGGGYGGEAGIVINASRSTAGGSAWLVCGFSDSRRSWDAVAVCAKANVEVQLAQSAGAFDMNTGACHTTECPEGTRVIGGGGGWEDSLTVDQNLPNDQGTGWTICGFSDGAASAPTVVAICADVDTYVKRDTIPESSGFGSGCRESTCNDDDLLLGGGVFSGLGRTVTFSGPRSPEGQIWDFCNETNQTQEAWITTICTENF